MRNEKNTGHQKLFLRIVSAENAFQIPRFVAQDRKQNRQLAGEIASKKL